MRSLLSMIQSRPPDRLGDLIQAYESSCASGEASLEAFWDRQARSHRSSTSDLAALIKLDLHRRYQRGERPRVHEYLRRFSNLGEDSNQVVSLVYEEFCLRSDLGESLDSRQFCEAYDPWRESLLSQLAYHRDFASSFDDVSSGTPFPECGETFGKYLLTDVLGKGAVARVYLATDTDLWDRQIVIKVSESFGQESRILSKLDHPKIVPILGVARSESGLTGICMPYRPGITLEKLVEIVGRGRRPDSARDLWNLIIANQESERATSENLPAGWMTYPILGTYSEAIAWIGLQLSEALGYLHGQGVLHRDIKPANILLAFGGGPMLLDFNLAQEPSSIENMAASVRGGTLPYMAPEHLHAFLESSGWKSVDHLADLYSLGLVLRELLTGSAPDLPQSKSSLSRAIQELIIRRYRPRTPAREINPLIPPSLDSILEKCLAFEPSRRFETADDLSVDLRRFLERRSLKSAANNSTAERAANWVFRNRPFAGLVAFMSLALILFLLFRTPTSIADRADFRKAEAQLSSTRPADWEAARRTFSELHRERPDSAWPTIYLALALEKLDPTRRDEISRLLKEARDRLDVEQSLLAALKTHPGSASLLMAQGLALIDAHRQSEGWNSIRKSLKIEPNQIAVLGEFISLKRSSENQEGVLDLCQTSIKVWKELGLDDKAINPLRQVMLPILTRLAEQALKQGAAPPDRIKAASHLDEIESVLEVRYGRTFEGGVLGLSEPDRFSFAFYRGVVDSGRGLLASENLDLRRAGQFYDQAEQSFGEAISSSPEVAKRQIPAITREREILTSRRAGLPKLGQR